MLGSEILLAVSGCDHSNKFFLDQVTDNYDTVPLGEPKIIIDF